MQPAANAPAPKKRRGLSIGKRNTLVGMSFILPNFIGFAVFIFVPVCFSLWLSFNKWDGFNAMEFVGLQNFVSIFKDRFFRAAFVRSVVFSLVTVAVTTFCALGLAVLVNKKIRGRGFFRSAIFFPYIASMVAVGAVWNQMLMEYGPINSFLRMFGLDLPGWLASTQLALPGVMLVFIWKNMGYFMVVYLAALQDVPTELYEASMIDGASKIQHFWRIVMPMLTNSTFFVVLMLTINSFKVLDLIVVMTDGGPGQSTTLLVNYIYNKAFISESYGTSSAAAMVLFIVVSIITVIQIRVEKRMSD